MVSPFDLVWNLLKQDEFQQMKDDRPLQDLSSSMFEADSKGYPQDIQDEMEYEARRKVLDELNRRSTNQGVSQVGVRPPNMEYAERQGAIPARRTDLIEDYNRSKGRSLDDWKDLPPPPLDWEDLKYNMKPITTGYGESGKPF